MIVKKLRGDIVRFEWGWGMIEWGYGRRELYMKLVLCM